MRRCKSFVALAVLCAAGVLGSTGLASANPIKMPTLLKSIAQHRASQQAGPADKGAVNPPAPPCPESGQLPSPFSNCGLPEAPATTLPYMGNMSYWGGKVQVHPRIYLVYWGWGQQGAFGSQTCKPHMISAGGKSGYLKCDPDGAGKYMADFVSQMGGTQWSGVSTQFFQTDANGKQENIANDKDLLAGIWVDDKNPADLSKTTATAAPGSGNTYTDLAAEAARAASHFGVNKKDYINANFVILQAPKFSDPNALSQGYCAFHDYTQKDIEAGIYKDLPAGLVYSNIPYQLAVNSGGTNVCGENAVNSGAQGKLDGNSIVLGHEIEEAITDPGAEDAVGAGGQTFLGAWYDPLDANENGDKCAWVGEPLITGAPGEPNVTPIPGAMGDIKGNAGGTFAVQTLWSNAAAGGAGYCAGVASTDLPAPLNGD